MKKSTWIGIGAAIAGAFVAGKVLASRHKEDKSIDDDNEYLNVLPPRTSRLSTDEHTSSDTSVRGEKHGENEEVDHSKAAEQAVRNTPGNYEKYVKPVLDSILSFGGLALLYPLYAGIAIAIKIDDPGPVFFTQKRVGKDKRFFMLHKFRTMKMSTPHDVPTHELQNPDQYITRVGRVLRRTSLDELPQIWDIWRGKMSIIGPRPALWNQRDLVECRDQYGANNVMPGLTGWAQINGRDELEIDVKAELDGEYVKRMSLLFDLKCFFDTIKSVLKSDGVVEGGTGTIHSASPIQPDDGKTIHIEDEYQIK